MKKIQLVEGLRAYLAFWVVFDHLLGACGYSIERLDGLLKIVRSGWYAVDVFIIISGFVIFYLLDNNDESYIKFITRRFFRLWPLFIVLFFISIPTSVIYFSNVKEFSFSFPYSQIGDGHLAERINSWGENIFSHILLHITMIHGMVPNSIVPYSPEAFLGPAWSISLEWQFYLIAPIIFNFLKKDKKMGIIIFSLLSILLFYIGKQIQDIEFGAFLPMHIEYFFLGIISYYLYKTLYKINLNIIFFPISLALVFFLFLNAKCDLIFIPYIIWLLFLSLLVDFSRPLKPVYILFFSSIFQNRLAIYLGRISYSIYLSHFLIIIILQYLILKLFPLLSQKVHLLVLTMLTVFFTIFVSHFLYKYIELFYIKKGKIIIGRMEA